MWVFGASVLGLGGGGWRLWVTASVEEVGMSVLGSFVPCLFFTTIEHRPTIQAQRDDANTKGQTGRRDIYDALLKRLDDTPT
ncbi:hypothetical protein GCM10009858_36130 [Terrabacter carboxydivorans]|uniref:Uncharacterized protein n=2 Tax=Terrabacter carboxydivorans TaxID=619730 RepID=A0ABN3M2U1_9MICO